MTKVIECRQCLINSSHTDLFKVDANGICNYCNYYASVTKALGSPEQKRSWLTAKVAEIKKYGKSRKYDCLLGISGGVDSSYLAYWAKQNGLRPLVVHFDNGWNSELAVKNIQNICDILGFTLQTYVINWNEFRQLQLAYLRAGVIDMEVLTDHAIMATVQGLARKNRIKYSISGFNYATEAIMPKGWVFNKSDFTNIRDINEKFGTTRIATYPHLTLASRLWHSAFSKIESIMVLNYIDYNKSDAKKLLTEKLGWRDYGGKHYESVFTKFYQAYILPTKFHIDKRYAHLSNLICSGQITKELAREELKNPLYTTSELQQEKAYVLKKLELSEQVFDKIMAGPVRKHEEFKTEQTFWNKYFKVIRTLKFKFN